MTNLFSAIPATLPAELVEVLLATSSLRIERIVSRGQASPADFWYDQEQHEWVLLVQGAAQLRFENEVRELRAGDFVHIPAHVRHRVEWTTPDETTIWLAVFYA
jgi:cupin 2 domain-containing protein